MKTKFFFTSCLILVFVACQNPDARDTLEEPEAQAESTSETSTKPKKILFFGDSLTAAYGLDPGEGFPAIIQKKLAELGYNYKVVNAGLSGETSAGGNERVDWVLQQNVDIFILELGANDGLRGLDPDMTYQNLEAIIKKVQEKAPEAKIILAGMEAPPNMGPAYTDAFRGVYARLAESNDLPLIPFLLKNVGGVPELNQADGIHPNVEGQKIVAENVWEVLKPVL